MAGLIIIAISIFNHLVFYLLYFHRIIDLQIMISQLSDSIMTDDKVCHLSIVMPCLNEVNTLAISIQEAQQALRILQEKYDYMGEIIIADNGSTDGSIECAKTLGVKVVHVEKRGYGNALRYGIQAANGRYIIMADSDASYNLIEAVAIAEKLREGYDFCMGNRFMGTIEQGAMSWKNRYIGNPILSSILNLIYRSDLHDAHCGIRGFTKTAFEKMHLTSTGMEFASEMIIKATLLGMSRTEIPVTLRPDGRIGPSHLRPFRDAWRHLRYLLMLSPFWLYFVPALITGIIGLALFAILTLNTDSNTVFLGPIWFGNHWITIAGAMIILAHHALQFGLITTLYGVKEGYRFPANWQLSFFWAMRLEIALLTGIILCSISAVLIMTIFSVWSNTNYGELDKLREIGIASTLMVVGIQHVFSAFLLSIICDNGGDIYELVRANLQTVEKKPE